MFSGIGPRKRRDSMWTVTLDEDEIMAGEGSVDT